MMWKSARRVLKDIRHRRRFQEPNWGAGGIFRHWPIASSNRSSNGTRIGGDDQKQQQVVGWKSIGRHFQDDVNYSESDGKSGTFEPLLQAVRFGSNGLRNVPHPPTQRDHLAQQVGTNAHQGWSRRSSSNRPHVGYQGAECTMSGWSLRRPGIMPDGNGSSGEILRVSSFSTKATADSDDAAQKSSSSSRPPEGKKGPEFTGKGDRRPKSIEDFQHEEIVGPTVERDMSNTANQLRSSLNNLTTFMTDLRNGLVLLGSVQLLAAVWSSVFYDVGLVHGLPQNLAFVVSFALAYLLRYYASALLFFRKVEERSRMKILTLSLQVAKMLSLFFYRSDFVVKAVAFGSLFALIADILQSYVSR